MAKKSNKYAKGQLSVMFTHAISLDKAKKIISSYGLSILDYFEETSYFLVTVPVGKERKWKKRLERNDNIKYVRLSVNI